MEGLTRVRVLRREQGLTQQELGRRSGLSRSFLSQVENGKSVPSLSSLTRISAALGVMPIEVLVRDKQEIRHFEERCGYKKVTRGAPCSDEGRRV